MSPSTVPARGTTSELRVDDRELDGRPSSEEPAGLLVDQIRVEAPDRPAGFGREVVRHSVVVGGPPLLPDRVDQVLAVVVVRLAVALDAERVAERVQVGSTDRPAAGEGTLDVGLDGLAGVAAHSRVGGEFGLEGRLGTEQVVDTVLGLLHLIVQIGEPRVAAAEDLGGDVVHLGLDGLCCAVGSDLADQHLASGSAAPAGNGADGFSSSADGLGQLTSEGDEVVVLAAAPGGTEGVDAVRHVIGIGDAQVHDTVDDVECHVRFGRQGAQPPSELLVDRRRGRRGEGGGVGAGAEHERRGRATEHVWRRHPRTVVGRVEDGVADDDGDAGAGLGQAGLEGREDAVGLGLEPDLVRTGEPVDEVAEVVVDLVEVLVDLRTGDDAALGAGVPDVVGHDVSFRDVG